MEEYHIFRTFVGGAGLTEAFAFDTCLGEWLCQKRSEKGKKGGRKNGTPSCQRHQLSYLILVEHHTYQTLMQHTSYKMHILKRAPFLIMK